MLVIFLTLLKASIPDALEENKNTFLNSVTKSSINSFRYRGYKLPEIYDIDGNKIPKSFIEYDNCKLKIYNPNLNKDLEKCTIKRNSILLEYIYSENYQNKKIYFAYDRSAPDVYDENFEKIPGASIKGNNAIICALDSHGRTIIDPYFIYNVSILKVYGTDSKEIKDFSLYYNHKNTLVIYDNKNDQIDNAKITYEKAFLTVNDENGLIPNAYISFLVKFNRRLSINYLENYLTIQNPRERFTLRPMGTNGIGITNGFISYIQCESLTRSSFIKYNQNYINNQKELYKIALDYTCEIELRVSICIKEIIKKYGTRGELIINKLLKQINNTIASYGDDPEEIVRLLTKAYWAMKRNGEYLYTPNTEDISLRFYLHKVAKPEKPPTENNKDYLYLLRSGFNIATKLISSVNNSIFSSYASAQEMYDYFWHPYV